MRYWFFLCFDTQSESGQFFTTIIEFSRHLFFNTSTWILLKNSIISLVKRPARTKNKTQSTFEFTFGCSSAFNISLRHWSLSCWLSAKPIVSIMMSLYLFSSHWNFFVHADASLDVLNGFSAINSNLPLLLYKQLPTVDLPVPVTPNSK